MQPGKSPCVGCCIAAYCLLIPIIPNNIRLCKRCKRATVFLGAEGIGRDGARTPHRISKVPSCIDIRLLHSDWLCDTCVDDVWDLGVHQHKEELRARRKNVKRGGKSWRPR